MSNLIFCLKCERDHDESEFKIWLSDKTKIRRCDRMNTAKHVDTIEKVKLAKRAEDAIVTKRKAAVKLKLEAIQQAKEDKLIDDEYL